MRYMIIFGIVLCGLLGVVLISHTVSATWYDSNYKYRSLISIDNTYISELLKSFPIYIYLNSSFIENLTMTNGSDMRFIALDNTTVLPYEIENITRMGAAVWVNVSTVYSTMPTGFWVYYNNTNGTFGQDSAKVWDQWYTAGGVWHMNDSALIWDSTANRHSHTSTYVGTGTDASGRTGNATWFDGTRGYKFGDICDVGTNLFTLEVQWNWTTATGFDANSRRLAGKYNGVGYYMNSQSASNRELWAEIYEGVHDLFMPLGIDTGMDDGKWRFSWLNFTSSTTAVTVTDARWFKGASSGVMNSLDSGEEFRIGTWNDAAANSWKGTIDEVRISIGTCRNESWMNATNATISKANFLTFGERLSNTTTSIPTLNLSNPYPVNDSTITYTYSSNLSGNITFTMNITRNISDGSSFDTSVWFNNSYLFTNSSSSNGTISFNLFTFWNDTLINGYTYNWSVNASIATNSTNETYHFKFTTATTGTATSINSLFIIGIISGLSVGMVLSNRRKRK